MQRRRRVPEWKQGWTEKTLTSISAPPLHLYIVFIIVIFLMWCSTSSDQSHRLHLGPSIANLQLLVYLSPVLLILFMACYFAASRRFILARQPAGSIIVGLRQGPSLPWGVALLVVMLLVLVSYQTSFQSLWLGPLRRSD